MVGKQKNSENLLGQMIKKFWQLPLEWVLLAGPIIQALSLIPEVLYHFGGEVDESPLTIEHLIIVMGFGAVLLGGVRYLKASRHEKTENVLFAVGLVSVGLNFAFDIVFHLIFGVETSVEAVLTITHFFLAFGFVCLFANAFVRALLFTPGAYMPFSALLSGGLAFAMIALYFNLLSPLFQQPAFQGPRPTGLPEGSGHVLLPVAGAVVATVWLLIITYAVLTRWFIRFTEYALMMIPVSVVTTVTGNNPGFFALFLTSIVLNIIITTTEIQLRKGWEIMIGALIPAMLWTFYLFFALLEHESFTWGFYSSTAMIGFPVFVGIAFGTFVFCLRNTKYPNVYIE